MSLLTSGILLNENLNNLVSPANFDEIIYKFPIEFKKVTGLRSSESDFSILIQYGLITLRTRFCVVFKRSCNDGTYKISLCPVCNPVMRDYAKKLPILGRTESYVWCPILKKFCNSQDKYRMTPEGAVYTLKVGFY